MSQKRQLKVFVTGPTGTTGRIVAAELLKRGHLVTGFSKNPAKYGTHPNYTPVSGSVINDLNALKAAVEGHDVVVNCFAPSHSTSSDTYVGLIEGAWHLKDAVKAAKSKPYFIYVGGAGSLRDPVTEEITLDEPEKLTQLYFAEGPIEHLQWLRYVIGAMPFHLYYHARIWKTGWFSWLPRNFLTWFDKRLVASLQTDKTMPHACRAAVALFEHDYTFDWSFLSPPWFYRSGPSAGEGYGTTKDYQPVDDRGRWLGINNGDLALAIVDEVELQDKKWIHWSCYAKQPDVAYFYDNYKGLEMSRVSSKKL